MGSALMIGGFVVILLLFSLVGNTGMTSLPEEFPELLSGSGFRGEIHADGMGQEIPMLLTDEQFISCLCAVQVKEKGPFEALPSPAAMIRFQAGEKDCQICAGKDGSILWEEVGNEENTRRFFLDRTGNIFRSLYEEHLLSGGTELPDR